MLFSTVNLLKLEAPKPPAEALGGGEKSLSSLYLSYLARSFVSDRIS